MNNPDSTSLEESSSPDLWPQTYDELITTVQRRNMQLFRGHCDATWPLFPGLARYDWPPGTTLADTEQSVYFDFVTRAGDLLPASADPWAHIFAMQHFGLPTRLLDWTETLGVAIFFALKSGEGDAAVWMLNPYRLNQRTLNRRELIHPTELHGNYYEYYISRVKTLEGNVVAISPLRHNPRVFNQRAGFTLHDDLEHPLDVLHPEAMTKVVIPAAARAGARKFLQAAGISEFSLFPDLDGLARELHAENFSSIPRRVFSTPLP
jgi:hypothetical protein